MSVDRTLHFSSAVASKRSVMKRAERIAVMEDNGDFDPEKDSPLGLPKTRVKRSKAGGKSKKEEKPAEEGAEAASE